MSKLWSRGVVRQLASLVITPPNFNSVSRILPATPSEVVVGKVAKLSFSDIVSDIVWESRCVEDDATR